MAPTRYSASPFLSKSLYPEKIPIPTKLPKTIFAEYEQLYPAVDVRQELRNMKGWCISNPSRRKTKRGVRRFINTWLTKTQNRGGSGGGRNPPQQKSSGISFESGIAISILNTDTEDEFLKYCKQNDLDPKEIRRIAKIKKDCGGDQELERMLITKRRSLTWAPRSLRCPS